MNKPWADAVYTTTFFEDRTCGSGGLELFETRNNQTVSLGRITYWDAIGQFVVKLSDREVPLEIVEAFIQETKETIRTR
jgi:hypothetical protein